MILNYPRRLLLFVAILGFLPFVGRAVFVDDHAHFNQAIERGKNLTQLYSEDEGGLGWKKGEVPTEANGPVYFYTMGLWTRLVGDAEWTSHVFVFFISFLGLLGFYEIAKRYTAYPIWASLLWFITPHNWITANSLLLDSFLAPLMVGGLALFIAGWERSRWSRLVLGAILLGLAPLVKYTGVLGLVVAVAWIFFEAERIRTRKWLVFLIPMFFFIGWNLITYQIYNQTHFSAVFQSSARGMGIFSSYVLMVFTSGTMPFLLVPVLFVFFANEFSLARRLGTLIFGVLFFGMGIWIFNGVFSIGVQAGVWGAMSAMWAFVWLSQKKGMGWPPFLSVWVLFGMVGLAMARDWMCARYFVVVGPALVLLSVLMLERLVPKILGSRNFRAGIFCGLGLFAFCLALADQKAAAVDKDMAAEIHSMKIDESIYYPGAALTGMSYYLNPEQAFPKEPGESIPDHGLVLIPRITLPPQFYPAIQNPKIVSSWEYKNFLRLRTLGAGSGFYGSIWGPLPFSVSSMPFDIIFLVQSNGENPNP